ncbi:hypothetical protein THS27_25315 [Thalassospira sp. MCCC 1A01428]|nr:hypothetical protein THS27_25315 [Thalassospira sp. MCCC 1A01428]
MKFFLGEDVKGEKLFVVDFRRQKNFSAIPKKLAKQNDFFTLKNEVDKKFSVEEEYSKFEGRIKPVLQSMIKNRKFINGSDRVLFNRFIALLLVRGPKFRDVLFKILDPLIRSQGANILLESKEEWSKRKDQPLAWEDARRLYDEGSFEVKIDNDAYVNLEVAHWESAFRFLKNRKWSFYFSSLENHNFITSDNPAFLVHRGGGELENSQCEFFQKFDIWFPLSYDLVVISKPSVEEKCVSASLKQVASFNSMVISNSFCQVYSKDDGFYYMSPLMQLRKGGGA